MKKNDLFLLMSEIDPQYVLEAENATQRSAKKSEKHLWIAWQKWGVLTAACLILLLCAVPVAKRLMNGVTPGVIPPDSQPVTDVVENPDFVIENGVLLSYVGNDPNVVVPDEVVEISRDAFAEKGDIIDTITIGKNVEVIDYLFLSKVDHLSNLKVDEENKRFQYDSTVGVLTNSEMTVMIDVSKSYMDGIQELIDQINNMISGTVYYGSTVDLVVENVVLTLSLEERDDYDPDKNYGNNDFRYNLYIEAVQFKRNRIDGTNHKKLRELLLGADDGALDLCQGEDYALFSRTTWWTGGTILLMTEDGFYNLSQSRYDLTQKSANESFYTYRQGENGILLYERMPVKFVPSIDGDDYLFALQNGTGFDEFYKEEGYVNVSSDGFKYVATASYSLEEAGKKEEYCEHFEYFKEVYFKNFTSIDELYEFNKYNNVVSAK